MICVAGRIAEGGIWLLYLMHRDMDVEDGIWGGVGGKGKSCRGGWDEEKKAA